MRNKLFEDINKLKKKKNKPFRVQQKRQVQTDQARFERENEVSGIKTNGGCVVKLRWNDTNQN